MLTYFVVTFAISWGGLLAVGGLSGISGTTWQADPRLPFLILAMLAGPSVAGLLLTALVSGRIVGVPWGAWHLLTNDLWIAKTYSGGLPLALFVTLNGLSLVAGELPAYRVLMVGVYDRTGSLPIAMLMHASLSACTFILSPSMVTGLPLVAYSFALAAAWWIVVAVVAGASRGQVSRQTLRRRAA